MNQRPVAGAVIRFLDHTLGHEMVSGEDGIFTARLVPSVRVSRVEVDGAPQRFNHRVLPSGEHEIDLYVLEELSSLEITVLGPRSEPLRKANVAIIPPDGDRSSGEVWADEDGRAQVRIRRPGRYRVIARYRSDDASWVEWKDVAVRAGAAARATLRFDDDRSARIEGVVRDGAGRPVPEASLFATLRERQVPLDEYARDAHPVDERAWADADLQGRFTLEGLRPGHTYRVDVAARDLHSESVELQGGQSGAVIVLERRPRVSGRVVDERGLPLTEFQVHGVPQRDPADRFEVRPYGNTLRLSAAGKADRFVSWIPPKARGEVELGTLILEDARRVSIRVVTDRGAPVAGARVGVFWSDSVGPLELASGTTDAEGVYMLEALPLSNASLLATWGPMAAVGRIEDGASELILTLRQGGVLGGTVFDSAGLPLEAAKVNVWCDSGFSDRGTTGADGRFQFLAVLGRCVLSAHDTVTVTLKVLPGAVHERALRPRAGPAEVIVLLPTFGLARLHPGEVEGVVDGPLPLGTSLEPDFGPGVTQAIKVIVAGHSQLFRFSRLEPGRYTLLAGDGRRDYRRVLEVPAGLTTVEVTHADAVPRR